MKTIIFAFLLSCLTLPLIAQVDNAPDNFSDNYGRRKTVIAFAPAVWRPTLKFEQGIGRTVSLGFHLHGRYILWRGGKVEPFVRVYFGNQGSPHGGYVQIKGIIGTYKRFFRFTYDEFCDYDAQGNYVCYYDYTNSEGERFFSFGGGVTGGYQFMLGRNENFALDVFGGFQYAYNQDELDPYVFWRRFMLNFPVEIGLRFGVAF